MTFSPKKRPSKDDGEFMPVTKRLNLLSIDNSRDSSASENSSYSREEENEIVINDFPTPPLGSPSEPEQMYNMNSMCSHRSYNPSLSCIQNPIYYEANRVLFEAHRMRIFRIHMQTSRA